MTQHRIQRSRNAWGERNPTVKPSVSMRRKMGEEDRLRREQQAMGKLPTLIASPRAETGPRMQWRPIVGMVVLTDPKPPLLPMMEEPERRNGRRVDQVRWFSQIHHS